MRHKLCVLSETELCFSHCCTFFNQNKSIIGITERYYQKVTFSLKVAIKF